MKNCLSAFYPFSFPLKLKFALKMRLVALILLQFTAQMVLFSQNTPDQKVVSGTVLVNDANPLDAKALLASLRNNWHIKIDSFSNADKTIVFNTPGSTAMIAQLNYPADPIEIRAAAQLSWLWRNATEEALQHQAQVVISIVGGADKTLEMHQLFTAIAAELLETRASGGVYMNSQYLLLSKGFYTAAAHNMLDNQTLPLYCWVYFGMPGDGGGYTFGMEDFGLKEMEIVHSQQSNADIHATLYDAAMSVLKYNSRPQDGEAIVTEEGNKIPVKFSKGVFLEGRDVLKLEY
jgi:hypothetical protein